MSQQGRQKQSHQNASEWIFFFLFNYVLIQGRVSRSVMITIETEQYSNGKCKEHLLPKQKSLYQGLSIKHSLL